MATTETAQSQSLMDMILRVLAGVVAAGFTIRTSLAVQITVAAMLQYMVFPGVPVTAAAWQGTEGAQDTRVQWGTGRTQVTA